MHRFKDLRVWQLARQMTKRVYALSNSFPDEEKFGIQSQIRRAASSVMLNIAEGAGRSTGLDFARFLDAAVGSANEVQTVLIIAFDQGYIDQETLDDFEAELLSIRNMTFKLQQSLRSRNDKAREDAEQYLTNPST
jgi:four helix bundle protein